MNWIKKQLQQYKSKHQASQPGWLRKYIQYHPYLWRLDMESVARGCAVGLFTGMIPIIPFQTILAILVALLIRANLAVAFLVSWISNPLTILPIAYFTYYVGNWILMGMGKPDSNFEFSWKMDTIQGAWATFGIPFFVGLPFVALGAGILGYIGVKLIVRINKLFRRKK